AGMGTALAAVTVTDPPGVMKMDARPTRPAGQHPSVSFVNCFVRGDGQLLAANAPRPFDLKVDNCVAALGGSLLQIETPDDAPPAPPGQASQVTLAHVTAYTAAHLVHLKAGKDLKGLIPVNVQASSCLFLAAGLKALVHLDGPDTSEERMREL